MADEVIILYHFHWPWYFVGTFTEYPEGRVILASSTFPSRSINRYRGFLEIF